MMRYFLTVMVIVGTFFLLNASSYAQVLVIPASSGGTTNYTPNRGAYTGIVIQPGALSNVRRFAPTFTGDIHPSITLIIQSGALAEATGFDIIDSIYNLRSHTKINSDIHIILTGLNKVESFRFNGPCGNGSPTLFRSLTVGNNSLNRVEQRGSYMCDLGTTSFVIGNNSFNYIGFTKGISFENYNVSMSSLNVGNNSFLYYNYTGNDFQNSLTIDSNDGAITIGEDSFSSAKKINIQVMSLIVGTGAFKSLVTPQYGSEWYIGNSVVIYSGGMNDITGLNLPYDGVVFSLAYPSLKNLQIFTNKQIGFGSSIPDFVIPREDVIIPDLTVAGFDRLFYYKDKLSIPADQIQIGDTLQISRHYTNLTTSDIESPFQAPVWYPSGLTGETIGANDHGSVSSYSLVFKPKEFVNAIYP